MKRIVQAIFKQFILIVKAQSHGQIQTKFKSKYSHLSFYGSSIDIHPSPKVMAFFFSETKINMIPSSDLYYFWWVHEMYASVHFLCKIYWLFALTLSAPGFLMRWVWFFSNQVWTSSSSFPVDICCIQVKFCKLQTWYVVFVSPKFHGNSPHCYKTISK